MFAEKNGTWSLETKARTSGAALKRWARTSTRTAGFLEDESAARMADMAFSSAAVSILGEMSRGVSKREAGTSSEERSSGMKM